MKTANGFAPGHSSVSAVLDTRMGGYIMAAGAAVLYPVLRVLLDRYIFMVRFATWVFMGASVEGLIHASMWMLR